MIFALYLRFKFVWTKSANLLLWTQLFQMIRGNVAKENLGLNSSDITIVHKIQNQAKIVYKLFNLLYIICGERINMNFKFNLNYFKFY